MNRNEAQLQFDTLSIEGGLFTAEWLGKVASFKAPGQTDADYAVRAGFSTREEIAFAWRSAQHLWGQFKAARQPSGADAWTVTQRFVSELLRQSFGFTNLHAAEHHQEIEGRRYPVGYFAVGQSVPLVISVCTEPKLLDTPHDRLGDSSGDRLRRRSAFGLLQEFLNAADHALWGIASNGLLLRIARDNGSLTRPAWLEADLERLFEEENQAEFSVLWLLLHASRFGTEGQPAHECVLEQWRNGCRDQGTLARNLLRRNVEQSLEDLGQGFVSHPANTALREALGNGSLSTRDYFRQLLRLVYRLIFLLTVEERGILHPPGSAEPAKGLFERGYSLKRLRDKAVRRSAHDRHHDQWEGLKRVWLGLAEGEPRLALPALGGLFATSQSPSLDGARLENRRLLAALFHLAWLREAPGEPLTRVNWRDMGSEELGSIYESLLELTPQLAQDNRHFGFPKDDANMGNARKTSGSYYTPDCLVQELLDSALEPVVAEHLAPHGGALASGAAAAQAVLSITVCDPACGSGHFILAAARRLATHLARVQTEGGQPTPDDYRHALRQVVTRCIHGVDLNPMAVELTKIALWLEAYTPDAPLGFIDHHIRCGNALLGVNALNDLEGGIPDAAFTAMSDDEKNVVSALKKTNRNALKAIEKAKNNAHHMLSLDLDSATNVVTLEALPDDTLAAIEEKRAAFSQAEAVAAQSRTRIAANIFVAAFVLPKTTSNKDTTPTSQDLWLVMNGDVARPGVADLAAWAVNSVRALHWPLAFSQIFARGGFDCVIGNPPWEIVQARDAGIDEEQLAREKLWFGSGIYSVLSGRRDLYKLFLALVPKLLNPTGRAGFVLPIGFMFEDDCADLRKLLFDEGSVISIIHLQNAQKQFFSEVHASYRFIAATFARQQISAHRFSAVVKSPAELSSPPWYEIPRQEFNAILGEERSAVLFDNLAHANLHRTISARLRQLPMLRYRVVAEFHASSDKPLLATRRDSESDWTLLKNGSFHHFYPGFGPTEKFVGESDVRERLDRKGMNPEVWMTHPRLVFRDIARNDDSRTLIACLVPPGFVSTYDAPMVVPTETAQQSELALAFYAGYLTSFLADFLIRPFVDKHIKGYVLARVPIPEFSASNPLMQSAAELSLDLVRGSWIACKNSEIPSAFDRTNARRLELDAIYLKLAGVSQAEVSALLGSFASIRGEEIRLHGEFRTATLIGTELEILSMATDTSGEKERPSLPAQNQSPSEYSSIGVIRSGDDARLAGLVLTVIRQAKAMPRQHLTLALATLQIEGAASALAQIDADTLAVFRQSHSTMLSAISERLQPILRFFETSGAIQIQQQGTLIVSIADAPLPNGVIVESDAEAIAGILLRIVRASLEQQVAETPGTASQPATKQA